jgi:hypothetical protein
MSSDESESEPEMVVDYSLVHPVPGYGMRLDELPDKDDPLFVRKPLPSALSSEYLLEVNEEKEGDAVYVFVSFLAIQ